MKSLILAIGLSTFLSTTFAKPPTNQNVTESLIGTWILDMTPNDINDNNFAKMVVRKIDKGQFYGDFYRDGVEIQSGQINIQSERVYAALVSSDNSGSYNSTFYLEDGSLFGTTHAIERNFLAVWTATKQ
jgi:hypothetical protein